MVDSHHTVAARMQSLNAIHRQRKDCGCCADSRAALSDGRAFVNPPPVPLASIEGPFHGGRKAGGDELSCYRRLAPGDRLSAVRDAGHIFTAPVGLNVNFLPSHGTMIELAMHLTSRKVHRMEVIARNNVTTLGDSNE